MFLKCKQIIRKIDLIFFCKYCFVNLICIVVVKFLKNNIQITHILR